MMTRTIMKKKKQKKLQLRLINAVNQKCRPNLQHPAASVVFIENIQIKASTQERNNRTEKKFSPSNLVRNEVRNAAGKNQVNLRIRLVNTYVTNWFVST